jgi:hypothetical protein
MSSHFLGGVTEDRRTACIHKLGEIPIVMREIIYEKSNHTSYQRSRSVTGAASILPQFHSTATSEKKMPCTAHRYERILYIVNLGVLSCCGQRCSTD